MYARGGCKKQKKPRATFFYAASTPTPPIQKRKGFVDSCPITIIGNTLCRAAGIYEGACAIKASACALSTVLPSMNIAAALQTPSHNGFLIFVCALLAPDGLACALPMELRRMLLDTALAEYRVVPVLMQEMKPVPQDWSRNAHRHSMSVNLRSLFPLIAPGRKWSSPWLYRGYERNAIGPIQHHMEPPCDVHICLFKDRIHSDGQVDNVTVAYYYRDNDDHFLLSVVFERMCDGQWVTYTSERVRAGNLHLTFDAITQLVNDISPVLVATTVCKHGI